MDGLGHTIGRIFCHGRGWDSEFFQRAERRGDKKLVKKRGERPPAASGAGTKRPNGTLSRPSEKNFLDGQICPSRPKITPKNSLGLEVGVPQSLLRSKKVNVCGPENSK